LIWLDFRDSFGLLWSLRVQERLNATATQHGWKTELSWDGFRPAEESAAQRGELRAALRGLLRRFVSGAWIARRLDESLD
jgi:hypothetical protein